MNTNAKSKAAGRKRILVVDDHPMTRHGLTHLLNREPDLTVCGEAGNAKQALELAQTLRPDLVLVDLIMPDKSGLEFIKDLKALAPEIALLVLSMHDETMYAERALRAGARGSVMKSEGGEKILEAIRGVFRGQIYLSASMAATVFNNLAEGQPRQGNSALAALTDREFEVFNLLGRGLSTEEIGQQLHLSIKTVGTHRVHIKEKLNVKTGAELMKEAVRWAAAQPPA